MTIRTALLFALAAGLTLGTAWYLQRGTDEVRGAEPAAPVAADAELEPQGEGTGDRLIAAAGVTTEAAPAEEIPAPVAEQVEEPAPALTPSQQVLANYRREQGKDPFRFMSNRSKPTATVDREVGVKAARMVQSGQLDPADLSEDDRAAYEAYVAKEKERRAEARAARRERDGG